MENKAIQLKLSRGGAELSLSGDAETVKDILENLTSHGLRALSEFFYEDETSAPIIQDSQSGTQPVVPSSGPASGSSTSASIYSFKYHIDQIQILGSSGDPSQFAFDLDGDLQHRPDNIFGNLLATLDSGNTFGFKEATDAAYADGRINYLFTLQTHDEQFLHDDNALITLYRGISQLPGGGAYVIDSGIPPVIIKGTVVDGHFISDDPLVTRNPISVDLMIGLPGSGNVLTIPLHAIRIEFDVNADVISNAKLGGVIAQDDMSNILVPGLAESYTTIINNDQSAYAEQLKLAFDVGGGQSQAGDLKIDAEELLSNSLVQSALTPDLALFDSKGNYAPNDASHPNAFSFGCGFVARKADFT